MNSSLRTKGRLIAAVTAVLAAGQSAHAVNGTYSNLSSGGLWSAPGNWVGGIVADGQDGLADFSTLNIVANNTVHLDTARTIGFLKFGDTTPSNNWILDNNAVATNILTLATTTGTPSITTLNGSATITTVLAGTQGVNFIGPGTTILGATSSYTGATLISSGVLQTGLNIGSPSTVNTVNIASGATLALTGGTNSNTIIGSGAVTNSGVVTMTGDFTGFAGTITATNQFSINGAVVNGNSTSGSANAAFVNNFASTNGFIAGSGGTFTVNMGSLAGTVTNANIRAGNSGTFGTVTFSIGNLNTSTTYAGQINNNTSGTPANGNNNIVALTKVGTGTLTLTSGASVYLGATNISNGALAVSILANGGVYGATGNISSGASSIGASNNAAGNLIFSGGTLIYTGATVSTDRSFTIAPTANAAINVSTAATVLTISGTTPATTGGLLKSGAGGLTLTGAHVYTGATNIAAGTLTVGAGGTTGSLSSTSILNAGTLAFNRSDSVSVGSVISGAGSLVQSGTGTLTLTAANTFTGRTNVAAGTLALTTGSIASTSGVNIATGATFDISAASPAFTLSSATQTLAGSGTVNGSYANSVATVAPGGVAAIGTLTFNNNLSLSGGTLSYDLNGSDNTVGGTTNDLIAVSGNLNLTGQTVLSLNPTTTPTAGTTYRLINYSGTLSGSAGNLVAGSRAVTVDTSTAGQVNIQYTAGVGANLVWSGVSSNIWDVVTTPDWINTAGNTTDRFYNGDFVTFNDTGTATTVNLVTTVLPGSVAVSSTKNYTFTGIGKISGATGLTKSGASILTIATANDYTGNTQVSGGSIVLTNTAGGGLGTGQLNISSAGTVQVGTNSASGVLGNGTVVDDGLLVFNRSDGSVIAANISGGGSVTYANGLNTVNGANTYTGTTLITAGNVFPGSSAAFGTSTVGTAGGFVFSTLANTFANNFIFSGFAFEAGGARVTTISGAVTVYSSSSVVLDGGAALTLNGPVTGFNTNLTVSGGGALNIGGAFTLGGGTIFSGSTINFVPAAGVTNSIAAPIADYTFTAAGTTAPTTAVGTVNQAGVGTTILSGNSTYTGITNVTTGVLQLASNNALGSTVGNTFITGNAATSSVNLVGNITVPEPFLIGGRPNNAPAFASIINTSGDNVLTGVLTPTTGGTYTAIESDAGSLTINGAITPNVTAGTVRGIYFQGAGNGTVNGVISDGNANNGSAGGLSVNLIGPGTWTFNAVNTYTGATNVAGGKLIFGASSTLGIAVRNRSGGVMIASGAVVQLAAPTSSANRQLLIANPLTIAGSTDAWTGQLDITSNDLDLPGADVGTVTNQVRNGLNLGTPATPGQGITSTTALASTAHLTTIGVVSNSQLAATTFDGQGVGSTDVLVKYTYFGDANLDGKVDGGDYTRIDFGFLNPGSSGWYNGDFNYDNVIDGSDYSLIDNAYNRQTGPAGGVSPSALLASPTALAAGTSAVPEPASIALAVVTGLMLARRRR